jgi:hypothetical protein
MATTLKLRTDIKKLKGALSSKGLPDSVKAKLKGQLDKAQNELKAMQSGAKPRKVSTTKGTQTALTSLQKMIQKKKFGVYQGKGIDLKKDAEEGALPIGRRISKGIKGNQFGDKKSSKGHVYYEYRANRLDVKQPKKAQKYPKLEDGGMMAKGGEVKYYAIVDENTDRIYIRNSDKEFINKKYKELKEIHPNDTLSIIEFEQGGYMAKGGMSQGYDDREDERLGMEYGKMSSKDLNSTHARRDDARFEERGKMADGGELIDADKLYAIMQLDKEHGFGSLIDGQVYTKKEADEKKEEYKDYVEDGMEIKIFSVDELLKRESLPKSSKEHILDSFRMKKNSIENITKALKRNGVNYNWQESMAQGGVTEKEVVESNTDMVLSQIKAVKHHADELSNIVTKKSDIEAWVVAKIERASTDLSDITHYLDGQHEKMSLGGTIHNYVHKMDKK